MLTIAEIIQAFGGGSALSRALGHKHRTRVGNWGRIGIPSDAWPQLIDLAKRRRIRGITYDALRRANERLRSSEGDRAA